VAVELGGGMLGGNPLFMLLKLGELELCDNFGMNSLTSGLPPCKSKMSSLSILRNFYCMLLIIKYTTQLLGFFILSHFYVILSYTN